MPSKLASALFAGLVAAAAAHAAFTVYLQDGSELRAREPYAVEGDTAIIILENGTRAALPLAEIDVERTRRSNEGGLSGAKVLQDGRFVDLEEVETEAPARETLGSMIATGRATATSGGPTAPADAPAGTAPEAPGEASPSRVPYPDQPMTDAITQAFLDLQVEEVAVLQGQEGAPLLEVVADSESDVFRGLRVAARVLGAVGAARPGAVPAFDLHFVTPQGQEAGAFRMTPEQADDLDARRIEPSEYYVRYVRF